MPLVSDGHRWSPGRQASLDDAVMESSDAHQNQMNQILSNRELAAGFGRVVFDMLLAMKRGFGTDRNTPVPSSR